MIDTLESNLAGQSAMKINASDAKYNPVCLIESRGLELCRRYCHLTLLVILFGCLLTGCKKQNSNVVASGSLRKISIIDEGPLKVLAEISDQAPDQGTVFTQQISIIPQGDFQIRAVQGALFYDRDRSGNLETGKDGVVMRIEDSTNNPTNEFSISPGVVHSGPGIGPLTMECMIELETISGERKSIPLITDLSPIFLTESSH